MENEPCFAYIYTLHIAQPVHLPSVCYITLLKEWCLFIDSSERSFKGVLLHNGNKRPSIHIAHSGHLNKESYDNMELLLEAVKYNQYQCSLCGDLKVIDLLMGMQAGFIKYFCFL